MKILNIVGARPNFVKIAPLICQMEKHPSIDWRLVHTGQHYDERMSEVFFKDLQLSPPDVFLGIGSGSHAQQTGQMMMALETAMQDYKPDLVLVVGDVNSTLAGALAATKLGIPLAHVEAGLRSWDRAMPEEINRICTDAISDLLFTTSTVATDNLLREGIPAEKVHFVGNVMIDTLFANLERARAQSTLLQTYGLTEGQYGLVTLHRPHNVDDPLMLGTLLEVLAQVSDRIPLLFPLHPRTRARLEDFGLLSRLESLNHLWITPPLGYLDFLRALSAAKFTLMDSCGASEETTALGIPCLTLRNETDRPETVTDGTNTLVGQDPNVILRAVDQILDGHGKQGRIPPLWDGCAAQRIIEILLAWRTEQFQPSFLATAA
jgi:UDP-N-acetylglucosamine 2-epimerase (non-hydrolysing)